MNTLLLTIILVPIIEIYLFIKVGSEIGAFNTISLIFITAIIGLFYAIGKHPLAISVLLLLPLMLHKRSR